ncbi:hypothetical protein [Hymenobacter sp. DG25A]|uniref:hypothetical protein n=1 Tax=Hymenobacter sp. DG25A TaxID=1385663 RepID=UPI0006BCA758|nr:hypothetical protein [Hymenobacter sp. DG25A]ALD22084.1 hypothetical protein AM218_13770 [Hymenobacter sp. DG25A]
MEGPWARRLPRIFFALLLLIGGLLHRDYGVSWDEVNNHLNGLVSLNYAARQLAPELAQRVTAGHSPIPDIRQYHDSDHGPVFEMVVSLLGYVLTDGDARPLYFLRHLLVFCTFVLGVGGLYYIGRWRFQDWRWGLVTSILLVLSPRFFAEAFYNGKDIVFMALFTLAVAGLLWMRDQPNLGRVLVLGILTALATDIRVQGLLVALPTLAVLLRLPAHAYSSSRRAFLILVYLTTTLAVAFLGWPYLWATPVNELWAALNQLDSYFWVEPCLYWGKLIPANQLPWHYLPVWILITTPVSYSLLALLGLSQQLTRLFRSRRTWTWSISAQADAWFALWLLGPLLVVIGTQAVVYDGWRHVYFIYPALLLFTVQGLRSLVRAVRTRRPLRWVAGAFLIAALLELPLTAVRMVRMHPFQQVYFSFLPAPLAEQLFERDYWGLAFRQGLEWLLIHDASPKLTIQMVSMQEPLYNNSLLLPPAERARIQYQPNARARYYITGYRWHPQSYLDSVGREVYHIRADGVKILSIFQR